jgi:hypothetical protein
MTLAPRRHHLRGRSFARRHRDRHRRGQIAARKHAHVLPSRSLDAPPGLVLGIAESLFPRSGPCLWMAPSIFSCTRLEITGASVRAMRRLRHDKNTGSCLQHYT